MNFKRFVKRLPDGYQELSYIQNNRDEYIDSGLLGSDLYGCEIETKMMIWASDINNFALNGAYESGKTAQLGLVTIYANTVRVSANFGFQDALSVTGIERNKYTTIYVSDGLQKVDGQQVATYNYGSLITSFPFLILARKESSSISVAKYVKMAYFWIKKNGVYIRNYIPAKRLSDNICGLYDLANNTFSPSLNGNFTGGEVVNPEWTDIPYYIHSTATDSITTLPADVYADGTNATVGLVGNMSQSGTPTPQTPIQPSETGERTGNLFDKSGSKVEGITTYNYTLTGLKPNSPYTCSTNFVGDRTKAASLYFAGGNPGTNGVWSSTPKTFNTNASGEITVYVRRITVADSNPAIYGDLMAGTIWIMVNEGSTALPYEPYGYKIPISSANTTTPVYLGEVETTRKIKKLVLTGEESTWTASGEAADVYYVSLAGDEYKGAAITTVCTHFKSVRNATNYLHLNNGEMCLYNGATSSVHTAGFKYPNSSLSDFKSYLAQQYAAGTPVTVWYVQSTPTTGIVNEPLRKIGDYADTVSGITIPTITGKDSFDVLTTLKPSEVSLAYTGWHDATVKEWDGSQWV